MDISTVTISECARVALRNLEHPPGLAANAQELMEQQLKRQLENNIFFKTLKKDGHIYAYVMAWKVNNPWHGIEFKRIVIECEDDDENTIHFLQQTLITSVDNKAELEVSLQSPKIYKMLSGLGFGFSSLVLCGDVKLALENLPYADFGNLHIRNLLPDDVANIVLLAKQNTDARHGWYWEHTSYFDQFKLGLCKKSQSQDDLSFVILKDEKLVGYFDAEVSDSNEMWGSSASLDLLFDRSIQQKGLARSAYQTLLAKLKTRGVRVFQGQTSQPAVMKIGKQTGRWLTCVLFRKQAPFDAEHFSTYISQDLYKV